MEPAENGPPSSTNPLEDLPEHYQQAIARAKARLPKYPGGPLKAYFVGGVVDEDLEEEEDPGVFERGIVVSAISPEIARRYVEGALGKSLPNWKTKEASDCDLYLSIHKWGEGRWHCVASELAYRNAIGFLEPDTFEGNCTVFWRKQHEAGLVAAGYPITDPNETAVPISREEWGGYDWPELDKEEEENR